MQLDIHAIKTITLGALRTEEKDGFFTFSRFSEKQEAFLLENGRAPKLYSASSIRLEFYTKGGEVSFDYEISPGTAREYYSIDLLVDQVYRCHVSKETCTDSGSFRYWIPSGGEQRVTIYFPSTAAIRIRNVNLPDDYAPHRRKRKILALGDSSMQGYHPNHFQNTYANLLADFYDAEMLNQAIGGDCFCAANLDELAFCPDFIIVSYGTNDWVIGCFRKGEEAEKYFKRLTELYPKLPIFAELPADIDYLTKMRRNDDVLPVSSCVQNADDENFAKQQTLQDVRNLLSEIIKKHQNITAIDTKNFIPQYEECFYADHVHLTDLGNVLFGNALIREISKYYPGKKA